MISGKKLCKKMEALIALLGDDELDYANCTFKFQRLSSSPAKLRATDLPSTDERIESFVMRRESALLLLNKAERKEAKLKATSDRSKTERLEEIRRLTAALRLAKNLAENAYNRMEQRLRRLREEKAHLA